MLKNKSLKFKLVSAFLVTSCFLLMVGGIGYLTLQKISESFQVVGKVSIPNSREIANMRAAALGSLQDATIMTLPGLSSEERQKFQEELEEHFSQFEEAEKKYRSLPFAEGEEELYLKMDSDWKVLRAALHEVSVQIQEKQPDSHQKAQELLLKKGEPAAATFVKSVGLLRKHQFEAAEASVTDTEKIEEKGQLAMLIAIVIGAGLSLTIGWAFSGTLTRRFEQLASQLLQGADQVASASQQISSASEELSAASQEQASSLQETSASLDEINAMIGRNSENASKSKQRSESCQTTSQGGQRSVQEMIEAINDISASNNEIATQIESSNQELSNIVKMIAEIGNKTKVINDIVFQTKLLSFNASVEAARAGEHGKGFAVVAEEVGNLAQMSGNAAKEISTMLEGSIQNVENIVRATQSQLERLMSSSKSKIETGTQVAQRCGDVLNEVVVQVGEMSEMSSEIATASNEQKQGIQAITQAVAQLDQVTQQNASAAHQAASASTELSGQAEQLRGLVGSLQQFLKGGDSSQVLLPVAAKAQTGHKEKSAGKVLPLKTKEHAAGSKGSSNGAGQRVANGSSMPSDSDPRFQDF